MISYTNKQLILTYKKQLLFLLVLSVLWWSNFSIAFSQSVKVSARLDSNSVNIGDQVNLHLEVQYPKGVKVTWPFLPDTLSKIEVLQRGKIDTLKSDENIVIEKQDIKLICFDSGIYVVPSFSFLYNSPKDTTKRISLTDSLSLIVKNISVDTTLAIKDIKPPLEVPFSWKEAIPYIAGGLAILVIAFLIYYYFKKRKKKTPADVPVINKTPAHEEALEALKILEHEKLWQQGDLKNYHIRLSDIVRTYIERRYGINAMEYTTDEILLTLTNLLNNDSKEKLKQLLVLADVVKFAKAQPIAYENEMSLNYAYAFVDSTKQNTTENNTGKEETKS